MPISLTKINLNQIIKFKPTEHGLKIMADNHNSYLGRIPNWEKREPEFFKSKLDSNGFYSLQLNQFMNEFGSQLFAGCKDVVEGSDIYLVFNGSVPCSCLCRRIGGMDSYTLFAAAFFLLF